MGSFLGNNLPNMLQQAQLMQAQKRGQMITPAMAGFQAPPAKGFFGTPQGMIPGQQGSGFVTPSGQQAGFQQAVANNQGMQPLTGDARADMVAKMQAAQAGMPQMGFGGSIGGANGFGKVDPNVARKMQLQAGMGQAPMQMPGQVAPAAGGQMFAGGTPGFYAQQPQMPQQAMGFNPFGGMFGTGMGMGGMGNMGFSGMFGGGNPLAFLMQMFGGGY